MRRERDGRRARLAAHGRGPRRVARGELSGKRTRDDRGAAPASETEDADHQALLGRHGRVRRKPRLGRLEEKRLDGRGGGREKATSALG